MLRLIVPLCFALVALLPTRADISNAMADAKAWKSTIATNTLRDISATMHLGPRMWPYAQCNTEGELSKETNMQSQINKELLCLLHEKIKESEKNDLLTLPELLIVYRNMRTSLLKSGGLQNLLLANLIDRISLSHICSQLVEHPNQHDEAGQYLHILNIPPYSACEIANEFNKEVRISMSLPLFDVSSEVEAQKSLESEFNNYSALLSEIRTISTSEGLFEKPRNLLFFQRLKEVAIMNEVALPALIVFFKRGGIPEDLRLDDITRFKEIMGVEREKFVNVNLGVRRLYASHLKILVDEYSQGLKQSQIYKSALD